MPLVSPGGGDATIYIGNDENSRVPVDIGGATVNIEGDVTVSNEVEITNDDGNPVPVEVTNTTVAVDGALLTGIDADTGSIDGKLPALVSGRVPVDGSGVTQPVSDGGGSLTVDAASLPLPTGASTAAKQDTLITAVDGVEALLTTIDADTGAIDAKLPALSSGRIPVDIGAISLGDVEIKNDSGNPVPISDAGGSITVDASSLPLPTGAATSANQSTIIGHVDGIEGLLTTIDVDTGAIDTKLPSGLTVTSTRLLVDGSGVTQPVSGPLTDTQLRATAVPTAPNVQQGGGAVTASTTRVTLATDGPGVANLASIAGMAIPAHDNVLITYRTTGNGTGEIDQVVYKVGATTVATQTLVYDSSNRLSTVTKS